MPKKIARPPRRRSPKVPEPLAPVPLLAPLDTLQRYSVEEALRYLRTSRGTIYRLIADGALKVRRDGGRTYVPGAEIARYSQLPTDPTEFSPGKRRRGRPRLEARD